MLIFGKTLIVLVDAQELRRVAFANLFMSLLSGKNVLLLDCSSVESMKSAEIFSVAMKNASPLFVLNAGALSLRDPQITRDIAVLRLMMPKCLVLVMVEADWTGEIDVAVSLAINGVVSMAMPPRDVCAAIEIALMGGTYFPKVSASIETTRDSASPAIENLVTAEQIASANSVELVSNQDQFAGPQTEEKPQADNRMDSPSYDLNTLSRRQIEVLKTLQSGLSNKEIARSLGLSEATIKIHVSHLMRKFGVANRTQVAVMSRQAGTLGKTANPAGRNAPSL